MKKVLREVCQGATLPRLPRHPFHGAPEWKPSGILSAVVFDHGASVSTGFPSPDAGRGPRRSGDVRSAPWHTFVFCYFLLFALMGVVGVWAAEEPKDAREIRDVVKKLQSRYERTKDLQAEFKQTTRIEGFATPITSSGRLYIRKPGLLRWDYLDPTVEEIYVNRNDVMMYVPEHKQVLIGKLTQMAASQAPLQLLQGVAKLDEEFTVEPTREGERGEGGLPLITLLPKQADAEAMRTVVRLVLEVQPKTYFIKSVSIHEISGNISTFQFSNLKANTDLSKSVFQFDVPAGVEVVKAPALAPP